MNTYSGLLYTQTNQGLLHLRREMKYTTESEESRGYSAMVEQHSSPLEKQYHQLAQIDVIQRDQESSFFGAEECDYTYMGLSDTSLTPDTSLDYVVDDDIFALDEDALYVSGIPNSGSASMTGSPLSTSTCGVTGVGHTKTRLINVTKGYELPNNFEFANAAQDNYRLWLTRV